MVAEWTSSKTVTWDACSQYVGGAETAAWESLLEMGNFVFFAGQEKQAVSLVIDLVKTLEKVQLVSGRPCAWDLGKESQEFIVDALHR